MPILLKKILESQEKSLRDLQRVIPHLVSAAQKVYDEWKQDANGEDPELGTGGICQNIAEEFVGVLSQHGFECISVDNGGMGEQHVWAVVHVKEGVYAVDIPYSIYEKGGGYTWRKIQGVDFDKDDVEVYPMNVNWDDLQSEYY